MRVIKLTWVPSQPTATLSLAGIISTTSMSMSTKELKMLRDYITDLTNQMERNDGIRTWEINI